MKPLFVTVDTEGDNLWQNPSNDCIKTENVFGLIKFQELCEKYGVIPIYLTDFEMVLDSRFVDYFKDKVKSNLCEIGIHPHARNIPPVIEFQEIPKGGAYLIEYPNDIMSLKFKTLKNKLESCFETKIKTHRAGRWALNKEYISILQDNGILFDCSVTPGINWQKCLGITGKIGGSDYSNYSNGAFDLEGTSIREFPVSIFRNRILFFAQKVTLKNVIKSAISLIKRRFVWCRPLNFGNLSDLKWCVRNVANSDLEYLEFMIHSSELMPGCNPNFVTDKDVNLLFKNIEQFFVYALKHGFEPHTFSSWQQNVNKQ